MFSDVSEVVSLPEIPRRMRTRAQFDLDKCLPVPSEQDRLMQWQFLVHLFL